MTKKFRATPTASGNKLMFMYRLTHGLTRYTRSRLQYRPRAEPEDGIETAEGISGIAEESRGLTDL